MTCVRPLRFERAQVQLHDLISRSRADILDEQRRLYRAVRCDARPIQLQTGVCEARVGQPVSERIERLAREVSIRAALHGVVVERRQLFVLLVEGDRQAPRRTHVAEQDVGDCSAAALPRIPRENDGRQLRLRPIDGKRRARREHQYDGLARCVQRFEKLALAGRQAQIGAVAAGEARIAHFHFLAFDVAGQSADEHDDIGGPRHLERFFERRLRARPTPRQAHFGVANVLEVFQPQLVCPARLQIDGHARAAHALVHLPAARALRDRRGTGGSRRWRRRRARSGPTRAAAADRSSAR